MRYALLLMLTVMLTACGGRESRAIDACTKAIAARITDKPFAVDASDMANNAKAEGDDTIQIQSKIVFDPGTPQEETQIFDCRARFAAGKAEPDVIALSFVWQD